MNKSFENLIEQGRDAEEHWGEGPDTHNIELIQKLTEALAAVLFTFDGMSFEEFEYDRGGESLDELAANLKLDMEEGA